MRVKPGIEVEEDVQIIKGYTLLPILLEMLARDIDELKIYKDKIIYHHLIYYLRDVEQSIYPELQRLKQAMKKREMSVLFTEKRARGIYVEYKVRGYVHELVLLRSLIKAELMTLLMNMRKKVR